MTDRRVSPNVQQVPAPGGSGNVRTGAIRFIDDWPGLFIRGDDAMSILVAIRSLERALHSAATVDPVVASALGKLSVVADIIENDVRVK